MCIVLEMKSMVIELKPLIDSWNGRDCRESELKDRAGEITDEVAQKDEEIRC